MSRDDRDRNCRCSKVTSSKQRRQNNKAIESCPGSCLSPLMHACATAGNSYRSIPSTWYTHTSTTHGTGQYLKYSESAQRVQKSETAPRPLHLEGRQIRGGLGTVRPGRCDGGNCDSCRSLQPPGLRNPRRWHRHVTKDNHKSESCHVLWLAEKKSVTNRHSSSSSSTYKLQKKNRVHLPRVLSPARLQHCAMGPPNKATYLLISEQRTSATTALCI